MQQGIRAHSSIPELLAHSFLNYERCKADNAQRKEKSVRQKKERLGRKTVGDMNYCSRLGRPKVQAGLLVWLVRIQSG